MRKPLRLWTCFWGEKHLDLFEKALVRTLAWPQNRDALCHASWDIWTLEKEFPLVEDVAKKVGIKLEFHAADQYLADLETKYLKDTGIMVLQMFLQSARRCLETGAQMLIAPPDTLFGGDSTANILQAGEQKDSVVFVIHIRVLPTLIDALESSSGLSMSNTKLVGHALSHAHKSWTEAEFTPGHERINSFIGGIFWKRRPNGAYAVQHALPTPYLINWTKADMDFFSRQNPPGVWPPVFGQIDHEWPATLFPAERARVIGSSDDAFICEVTDERANIPALMNVEQDEPDRFWRRAFHNQMLRQFVVTLRGEE